MQEFLIAFLIAVVVGSMINGCAELSNTDTSASNNAQTTQGGGQTASQVTEITEANFDQEVLKSSQPVLVEFGASWCVPCKNMAPVLDQLSVEYSGKLKVVKIDTDENQRLAEKYTTGELPTIVVFKNGEPKERSIGEVPKEKLVAMLKGYLG